MVIFHSYVNVYRRVCSIQLGIIIIPTDFHIFQRGRSTINQQNASVWYFPTFFATFSKRIDTFDQPTWPEVEGHRIRGTMETLPCHLVQRLHWENANSYQIELKYGYGSIPITTIFNGMNIHLPAILGFTRGTRVLTHPHIGKLLGNCINTIGGRRYHVNCKKPSGKHTKKYGKSPFSMGKSKVSMCRVQWLCNKLPEGNRCNLLTSLPTICWFGYCDHTKYPSKAASEKGGFQVSALCQNDVSSIGAMCSILFEKGIETFHNGVELVYINMRSVHNPCWFMIMGG